MTMPDTTKVSTPKLIKNKKLAIPEAIKTKKRLC